MTADRGSTVTDGVEDGGGAPASVLARVARRSLVGAGFTFGVFALLAAMAPDVALAQVDHPVTGAWTGGAETAGVVRDARWLLRFEHAGGAADTDFWFGRASDEPIVGDWNGDGTTTVGVRRGSAVYLRNALAGGAADLAYHYGRAGDEVLVGDWDGDGVDTVGVRRGNTFYLRNHHSSGPANIVFAYGRSDDDALVGDWNGDGVDTVGIRRGKTFYLSDQHAGGSADTAFHYGRAGDLPLAGDWNHSGATTIGVRRDTRFLLRNANSSGPAHLGYHYGRSHEPEPEERIVSSFTTPLVPGQHRNVNIHLAADYIDGDVIAPGESYSLNQGIGPRTTERGFISNGFIDEGDVVSVVGGGVSQMATTFLNAAWFSGIQIDDFRPHSIWFQRYPMCREGTLSWGTLDVVVTNDSPHPITIATSYSSEAVTVSFVSLPWAEVDSWTGSPYAWIGESFRVDCGRSITYPDGTSSSENYTWRYDEAG